MDRVKQSAVLELDGQIAEKGAEIAQLQGETGASMWLADLEEFRQAWMLYSQERVASATSVAKSAPTDSKKKRPAIKK
jgi:hypothetical protein